MSGSVLIVDDSLVDRSIMKAIVRRSIPDIEIIESEDGNNLNALILKHDVKVCLLDLRMPIKDGYELLKEVKQDPLTMDTPVIVCTGIMTTSALEQVLTLGAFDYFSKPLSEEAMKVALPLKIKNAIELSNRTRHIVKMSQTDALTNLYNRAYFKQVLSTEFSSEAMPIAILMCDINGLKVANDAYGSEVGDLFLTSLSEIIQRNAPKSAVCSRWGGDEFAIFLPNTEKLDAAVLAHKIQAEFLSVRHCALGLSLACGWDAVNALGVDLYLALINAEDAMFRDKILEDVSVRSGMITTILNTLHEKNPREESHSRRVSELCQKMGEALGYRDEEVKSLQVMGLLHDIGKIAIDEHILNKPGHLNQEEWHEMKRHPEIGYRLLSSSPELQIYADAILCHHERMDGKGYPNGLKAEEIPLHSRILSIIDSYDAMTCERTYKKSLTDLEASQELKKHAGTQFDANLTTLFIESVLALSD